MKRLEVQPQNDERFFTKPSDGNIIYRYSVPKWVRDYGITPLTRAYVDTEADLRIHLKEKQIILGIQLLPSIRRVARVFGEKPYETRRYDDILTDVNSFARLGFNLGQVKTGMQGLQTLSNCAYKLAEEKLKTLPYDIKKHSDDEQNLWLAQGFADRIIWCWWKPQKASSPWQAKRLYRKISSSMKYLPHFLVNDQDRRENYYDDEDVMDRVKLKRGKKYISSRSLQKLSHFWERFYQTTISLNLKQVIWVISRLEERASLALLFYLGYFPAVRINFDRFALEKQIAGHTLNNDLRRAIINFEKTVDNTKTIEEESDIKTFIRGVWNRPIYRYHDQNTAFDSPRLQLLNASCASDAKFLAKLKDDEQKVLMLAMMRKGNTFLYRNEEIAKLCNVSKKTVVYLIQRMKNLNRSGEERFINELGVIVEKDKLQYDLIINRGKLTNPQLAALSPMERKILDYLTKPDKSGRYPSVRKMRSQKGFRSENMRKIARRIHSSGLENLKQQLEAGLTIMSRFTDREIRAMATLLEWINQGRPIGGQRKGIAITRFSKKFGYDDPSVFSYLIYKAIPHRIKDELGIS